MVQAPVYHRTYYASKTDPDTLFSGRAVPLAPLPRNQSAWCHALLIFCHDLPGSSGSTTNTIIVFFAATFVNASQPKVSVSHSCLFFFIVDISSSKKVARFAQKASHKSLVGMLRQTNSIRNCQILSKLSRTSGSLWRLNNTRPIIRDCNAHLNQTALNHLELAFTIWVPTALYGTIWQTHHRVGIGKDIWGCTSQTHQSFSQGSNYLFHSSTLQGLLACNLTWDPLSPWR
jgi:hypothetical protein